MPITVPLLDFKNRQIYADFNLFIKNIGETPLCDDYTAPNQLPNNCTELATTPGDLVRKLIDEQKLDPLIIPHGNSWGFYTPLGTT